MHQCVNVSGPVGITAAQEALLRIYHCLRYIFVNFVVFFNILLAEFIVLIFSADPTNALKDVVCSEVLCDVL